MGRRVKGKAVDKDAATDRLLEWPKRQLDATVRVYSAYNSTRQEFLCPFVETADLMPKDLREALDQLTRDSRKALWLIPFRGIAASQVNKPIDLVFLDQNHCVLSMAESFPESHPDSWNWPVGSAIVMPAGMIAMSGTLTGDQLVLLSPEKMRPHIVDMEMPEDDEAAISARNPRLLATPTTVADDAAVHPSSGNDLLNQQEHDLELTRLDARQEDVKVPEPETAEPAVEDLIAKERDWLLCVIAPHSQEKRMTPRESLPWIAAYFFTGGTPAPAEVRNISSLGMYVITTERWYPGTIIRVTLSDWRLQSPGRAITVNAMAVRADEEGVGLRFVFAKPRKGKRSHPDHRAMVEITRAEVREFLQALKKDDRQGTWQERP